MVLRYRYRTIYEYLVPCYECQCACMLSNKFEDLILYLWCMAHIPLTIPVLVNLL